MLSATFGLISSDFWCSDENFQEAITDSYAYRLGFENGIAEFDGVIDIEKLRLMLIEEPLVLFKPFCHWGYFEKPSTIDQSMDNLKKAMNIFNSKN